MRVRVLAALATLAACSGKSVLNREQLDSELTHLRSLASETQFLGEVSAIGHTTRTFASKHAEYLRKQVQSVAQKLARAIPAPGLETDLARARAFADRLERQLP